MTLRDLSFRVRSSVSWVLTAAALPLSAMSASAQDTTGVGAIAGVVISATGQPAEGVRVCALDTNSCATSDTREGPFASASSMQAPSSWNRRTNTQQFGEQQGLFSILGLDWRF